MSSLFSMLGVAAQSLDAQRFGLDVTGQNIANVNTPGYTRRTALLSDVPPTDRRSAGRGVQIDGVAAERNRLVERRLWTELGLEQRSSATVDALTSIDAALSSTASVDERLGQFFDAFAKLAEAPTSATARQEVVLQGRSLATSFRGVSERFDTAEREADQSVRGIVDDINALASRVAELNEGLGTVGRDRGEGLHLQDEVRAAVEELSKLASVELIERGDGGFDVAIGGGRTLVIGAHAHVLTVSNRDVTGFADVVTADGTVITDAVSDGALAGYVQVRDRTVPAYRTMLDDLAFKVVQQVNAVHSAGYDYHGDAGQNFFLPLASADGASAAISLNPAMTGVNGEARVAASSDPSAVGDNGAARAMAALRDARVLAGGTATFTDYWGRLLYRVGRDVQNAKDTHTDRLELVKQIEQLRDSTSGVSLDEEAANMMKFQRAYEANARYFSTVNDAITILMQMVGA